MMHESPIQIDDDYKKKQEAIKNAIEKAAKSNPTEILKSQAKEMDTVLKEKTSKNCEIARMLFNEGLEMYESGDMKFGEMIEDLHKSLTAIEEKE